MSRPHGETFDRLSLHHVGLECLRDHSAVVPVHIGKIEILPVDSRREAVPGPEEVELPEGVDAPLFLVEQPGTRPRGRPIEFLRGVANHPKLHLIAPQPGRHRQLPARCKGFLVRPIRDNLAPVVGAGTNRDRGLPQASIQPGELPGQPGSKRTGAEESFVHDQAIQTVAAQLERSFCRGLGEEVFGLSPDWRNAEEKKAC